MKSHATPLRAAWDVNRPLVQGLHAARASCSSAATSVIRSAVPVSGACVQVTLIFLNNGAEVQEGWRQFG